MLILHADGYDLVRHFALKLATHIREMSAELADHLMCLVASQHFVFSCNNKPLPEESGSKLPPLSPHRTDARLAESACVGSIRRDPM